MRSPGRRHLGGQPVVLVDRHRSPLRYFFWAAPKNRATENLGNFAPDLVTDEFYGRVTGYWSRVEPPRSSGSGKPPACGWLRLVAKTCLLTA